MTQVMLKIVASQTDDLKTLFMNLEGSFTLIHYSTGVTYEDRHNVLIVQATGVGITVLSSSSLMTRYSKLGRFPGKPLQPSLTFSRLEHLSGGSWPYPQARTKTELV
jgi:hypothetical protein